MLHHSTQEMASYLQPGKHVHLIGIGGVSMCALAEVLKGMGHERTRAPTCTESDTVDHLRSVGIPVTIGHSADNLQGCDLRHPHRRRPRRATPRSPAAIARGIPVFERAQAWGAIMQALPQRPVRLRHPRQDHHHLHVPPISSWRPGMDPTVMIGGTLPLLGAGYRVGKGDTIILESCEYCNSFLNFFPTVAVILNVDGGSSGLLQGSGRHRAFLPPVCRADPRGTRHRHRQRRRTRTPWMRSRALTAA